MTPEQFQHAVLGWYDLHGRKDLPWQQHITPYRVWVSEIMLQQTQVATVVPYYQRFMAHFPDIETLAAAPEDEVLHLWTGLGYYARARNLHHCARLIVSKYDGLFPEDPAALTQLPGIGRSTAGAIAAIAMDIRAPILDGNVKRVLGRLHAITDWPGKTAVANQLWSLAEDYTPRQRLRDYTQAIMDLGATICTRNNPKCLQCPLHNACQARLSGSPDTFPGRKPRKERPVRSTLFIIATDAQARVALIKRPASGLWGGLWCFPETDSEAQLESRLAALGLATWGNHDRLSPFRHSFTHFHLTIHPVRISVRPLPLGEEHETCRMVDPATPGLLGLAAPVKQLLEVLAKNDPCYSGPR